ncbi:hypothetical protein, partial [Endozoicomonas sp. ONNA2]|uniref:hypothetical protein n=1 Tax=Endozoicomonas sp. ONNA2 TaxID=2828741 RepID=UPI002148F3DD
MINELTPTRPADITVPDNPDSKADSKAKVSTTKWPTAGFLLGCAEKVIKHIPNPAYYATSAPARLITLL